VKQLQDAVKDLVQQMASRDNEIAQLQQKTTRLEGDMAKDPEKEEFIEKMTRLELALNLVQQSTSQNANMMEQLNQKVRNAEQCCEAKNRKIQQTDQKLDEVKTSVHEKVNRFERELDQVKQVAFRSDLMYVSLEKDFNNLLQTLDQKDTKIDQAEREISGLKKALETNDKKCDQAVNDLRETFDMERRLGSKIDNLVVANISRNRTESIYSENGPNTVNVIEHLKTGIDELEIKINSMQVSIDSACKNELTKIRDECKLSHTQNTNKIVGLKSQIGSILESNAERDSEFLELTQQLQSVRDGIGEEKVENSDLQSTELSDIKQSMLARNSDSVRVKVELNRLKDSSAQLVAKIGGLEKLVQSTKQSVGEHGQRIGHFETEVKETRESLSEMGDKIDFRFDQILANLSNNAPREDLNCTQMLSGIIESIVNKETLNGPVTLIDMSFDLKICRKFC